MSLTPFFTTNAFLYCRQKITLKLTDKFSINFIIFTVSKATDET